MQHSPPRTSTSPKRTRIIKLGGLPADITPHTLRHSFASLAGDLGYSESTIAALVGHKRHTTTSRYVHTADTVLLAACCAIIAQSSPKLIKLLVTQGLPRGPKLPTGPNTNCWGLFFCRPTRPLCAVIPKCSMSLRAWDAPPRNISRGTCPHDRAAVRRKLRTLFHGRLSVPVALQRERFRISPCRWGNGTALP